MGARTSGSGLAEIWKSPSKGEILNLPSSVAYLRVDLGAIPTLKPQTPNPKHKKNFAHKVSEGLLDLGGILELEPGQHLTSGDDTSWAQGVRDLPRLTSLQG